MEIETSIYKLSELQLSMVKGLWENKEPYKRIIFTWMGFGTIYADKNAKKSKMS